MRSDCHMSTPKQSRTSCTPSSMATMSISSSARSRWSTPLWGRWALTLVPEELSRRPQTNPVLCCSSAGGLLPGCPSLQEWQRRLATGAGALLDVLPQGPPQLLSARRLLLLLRCPAVADQRVADQPPASRAGSLHHAGKQVNRLNPADLFIYGTPFMHKMQLTVLDNNSKYIKNKDLKTVCNWSATVN